MTVVCCIENNMGISFGGRRVSRDVMVCSDLLQLCQGHTLYMAPTSVKLFAGLTGEEIISISETIPECNEDFYFYEGGPQDQFLLADRIILYKWNRDYPSDLKLELDLSKYDLKETYEFPGNSHDLITRKIYERKS